MQGNWKKKTVEHENDDYTSCNWCSWNGHPKIGTRTGRLGNNGTGGYYPNNSIVEIGQNTDCPNNSTIEIGQNTEKSHENLRKFAVTQTPVENHQLTLMWKTTKEKDKVNKLKTYQNYYDVAIEITTKLGFRQTKIKEYNCW